MVGAGAKLIDMYRALAAKGVTVPAGSCPTVGVSGLTLGGGHGVVSRAYGLTCDSLTQATLITADGKQVVANKSENKDLFWALRGAGNGNFGVVTELRFRTHPAPQAVSAYMTWPWSKATAVLKAWQEWGPSQPDEIWSSCHIANAAGGRPTISIAAFSLGTYRELQNAVDRLADGPGGPGPASNVSLKRRSYEESMEVYAGCSAFAEDAMCHLPGTTPGRSTQGALGRETYAARSDFFDRSISSAGIRAMFAKMENVTSGSRQHRADRARRGDQPRRPDRHRLRAPALPDARAVHRVLAGRNIRLHRPRLARFHPRGDAPVRVGGGVPELHGPDADGLAQGVLRRRGRAPDDGQEAVRPEPLLHVPAGTLRAPSFQCALIRAP